jgi:hypothetical protein
MEPTRILDEGITWYQTQKIISKCNSNEGNLNNLYLECYAHFIAMGPLNFVSDAKYDITITNP